MVKTRKQQRGRRRAGGGDDFSPILAGIAAATKARTAERLPANHPTRRQPSRTAKSKSQYSSSKSSKPATAAAVRRREQKEAKKAAEDAEYEERDRKFAVERIKAAHLLADQKEAAARARIAVMQAEAATR